MDLTFQLLSKYSWPALMIIGLILSSCTTGQSSQAGAPPPLITTTEISLTTAPPPPEPPTPTATLVVSPTITPTPVEPDQPAPTVEPTVTEAMSGPHMEISVDSTTLKVGDTLTVTGRPVGIGIPIYTLYLDAETFVTIGYDLQIHPMKLYPAAKESMFEVISASSTPEFVLRALTPGTVEIRLNGSGETSCGDGCFQWANGSSEKILITVTD